MFSRSKPNPAGNCLTIGQFPENFKLQQTQVCKQNQGSLQIQFSCRPAGMLTARAAQVRSAQDCACGTLRRAPAGMAVMLNQTL